jgi:biotin-[acetyl-CoA-carboxylase] ligase BirA-like protein
MEIIHLKVIESTSTHAAELIRGGKAPPFCVRADEQSQGRGRRGHHWQSPRGNLYFSIVLPLSSAGESGSPSIGSSDKVSTLPLLVGACLATWARETFGFHGSLKWPNDLFFSGKKWGGVLCEGSQQQGSHYVIVGIGLNVKQILKEGDFTYDATTLSEILSKNLVVEEVFSSLMAFIAVRPFGSFQLEDFRNYCLGPHHTWQVSGKRESESSGDAKEYTSSHVNDEGHLVLSNPDDHRQLTIASSHERLRVLFGKVDEPLLLMDIGNSQSKCAVYEGALLKQVIAGSNEAWQQGDGPRAELVKQGAKCCYGISVNPSQTKALTQALAEGGLKLVPLKKRRLRSHGESYDFEDLGIDRLAAMEGFLAEDFGESGVVVSLGTAVTVDILHNREHLGGMIFPGALTALKSLRDRTGLLPDLAPQGFQEVLGRNTQEAMQAGVRNMVMGAIHQGQQHLRERGARDFPIVVTGGHMDWLKECGNGGFHFHQHLNFSGIKALFLI